MTWAYEGSTQVLNGLWKPFGDRAFGLINLLGSTVIPIRGKTTREQEEDLFNALYDIHGEKTGFLMDHPAISPFPDGLGLFVVYKNADGVFIAEFAPSSPMEHLICDNSNKCINAYSIRS